MASTAAFTAPSLLGATQDSSGFIFYFAVSGTTITNDGVNSGSLAAIGLANSTSPAAVSWTAVYTSKGSSGTFTYPLLGSSGDIFLAPNGKIYIASNSNPNRMVELFLNYTTTTLALNSAIATVTAVIEVPAGTPRTASIGGAAVNPIDGFVYLTSGTAGTDRLTSYNTSPATGVNVAATAALADSGNCPEMPLNPTMSKAFGVTYTPSGSTTLTITVSNPNKAPIFLTQNLTDTFPAGMVIYSTPGATASCFSAGAAATRSSLTTVTAVAGASSFLVNSGSMIPGGTTGGGSCSFSVNVTGTAALTSYTNTIFAGSLTTSVGSPTANVTATLKIGTDFSVSKLLRASTSGVFSATATIPSSRTMQYQLTFVNSAQGGTGTMTYTDTLPVLITPVLSVTAVGNLSTSCTSASFLATAQQRITGTFAGPPGSTCTITVTARGTSTTANNVVNTTTLAVAVGTGDAVSTNNSATATATISAVSTITIVKLVTPSTSLVSGNTVDYTVTVANLIGGAAAPGSLLKDPAVSGLTCSAATCTGVAGGAVCPTQASTTIAYLQGTGVQITTFPGTSTLTFRIRCTVN